MKSALTKVSLLGWILMAAAPLSGCDALSGKPDKSDRPAAAGDTTPRPSLAAPPVGAQFAGIYRSTYGDVRLRPIGGQLEGTYPGGTMKCAPSDKTLTCDWKDSSGFGRARLVRQDNGDLKGSWGNGASDSNGGTWLFNLLSAGDPGPTGNEAAAGSFAGDYISTYGTVNLVESPGKVKGTYPGGTLDCTPRGAVIDCGWKDSSGFGRSTLTRQANGNLSGTWGNGGSSTDGGTWLFRKK